MSGFFFWGMIELPVAKASGSSTNPNSKLEYKTSSSARRESVICKIESAAKASRPKSRLATASSELGSGRRKPSSLAVM